MGMSCILVHRDDIRIRQKPQCLLIQLCHLRADHQRGTEDAPQSHHGFFFIISKRRTVVLGIILPDRADRQHIRIRPVTGATVSRPLFTTLKHIIEQFPVIPEIIGNTPHIGRLLVKLCLFQQRRPRRKAQDHLSAAIVQSFTQQDQFTFFMRQFSGDVIALDKVYAPLRIQFEDTVVVLPRAFLLRIHAVHIGIPVADAVCLCHFSCRMFRTKDRCIPMYRLSGDTAHDMDTEFQP